MFCAKCGANVEEGKAFCGACGQPVLGYSVSAPSTSVSPLPGTGPGAIPAYASPATPQTWQATAAQQNVAFAGFWLRLVAAIIDGVVLSIPLMPVFLLVFLGTFRNMQDVQSAHDPTALWAMLGPKILLVLIVSAIASWLYWGLLESSAWQATLGKKALGLIVTDLEGRRVTFARASGRFWAGRGVSSIPYLGGTYFLIDCVCAGFTARKQAIHDMIASCLVLRKL
jgi:uncharacterized RDD family membrane protein YckC